MLAEIERRYIPNDLEGFLAENNCHLRVPNSVLNALISIPKIEADCFVEVLTHNHIEYLIRYGQYKMTISVRIINGQIVPEIREENRFLFFAGIPGLIFVHQVPIDLMETMTATHSDNVVEFLRRIDLSEVAAVVAAVVNNKTVKEFWRNNQKIYGIKEIRYQFGCGLLVAKIAFEAAAIFWNK